MFHQLERAAFKGVLHGRYVPSFGTRKLCNRANIVHSKNCLRGFTSSDDSSRDWIPPQRPLSGDKSQIDSSTDKSSWISPDFLHHGDNSDLDEFLKEENKISSDHGKPDWLSTRKSRQHRPTHMLTPSQSAEAKRLESEITVIEGTLLTSEEIMTCLKSLGGQNVVHVTPVEKYKEYLGWKGLIISTGTSYSHIKILSDAIVKNLQKRDLAKRGVIGARYGSEGGEKRKKAIKKNRIGRADSYKGNGDDGWISVDCMNYVVHIQDDITRRSIDLEGLWSGEAGNKLRNVNSEDEDSVDDYVAANPVPEDYMNSLVHFTRDYWSDGRVRGGMGANNKGGRWSPSSNQKRKSKNKGRRRL